VSQHLGVDVPGDQPLKIGVWHLLVEAYIESRGFPGWTHLHPTFYMVGPSCTTTPTLQPAPLPLPHTVYPPRLEQENLITYGGVRTIHNKTIVVPFKPEVPVHCI
jgi:hypothetical protein